MIRASSAQDAELCGFIKVLQQRHPRTYRATLMGTAFHAKSCLAEDAPAKLAMLTDEEREEVLSWPAVADFKDETDIGYVTLTYHSAFKEYPVGLDENGCYMPVATSDDPTVGYVDKPGLLVPATVDMWWSYDHPRGKTVFVGDIKTGQHEIASGARNLQFVAPALALAEREGADWYRTGIWYAREGRWELGPAVHVSSALALQDLTRLQRAATNPPVPVVGGHCNDCFQRQFCDAYMLPHTQLETALRPLCVPGGLEAATPEERLAAVMAVKAMTKLADLGNDTIKAWLESSGPQQVPGGVLKLERREGREYADMGLVKLKLPEAIKRSKPSFSAAVRKS